MSLLDKLFGHNDPQPQPQPTTGFAPQGNYPPQGSYGAQGDYAPPQNADEQAIARYRYMLKTAPPEDIERAHEEAFARLTPQQRQMVLQQLTQSVSPAEAGRLSLDPRSLAQATTRAEIRQPGFIERTFGAPAQSYPQPGYGQPGYAPQQGYPQQGYAGPMGGGMMGGGGMLGGMGGMLAGGLLSSMAGSFLGTSIANSFFSHHDNERGFLSSPEAQAVPGGVSDYNPTDFGSGQGNLGLDASADPYGDPADAGSFQNVDTNSPDFGSGQGNLGLDSSADPYGDPADSGGFADTGFDSGGFDSGGFDAGSDFGGGDF